MADHQINYDSYAEMIRQGNLVAFPTETVYGLGASAWSPLGVRAVFEAKGRPADNPLIVHVSSFDMVRTFTDFVPTRARLMMQKFWPGPLTIILNRKPSVLDLITAGLDTVAVRMPDHPIALKLIDKAGPLVAPSANKSGRPSPTRASHVISDFGRKIPVIDGGECKIGLESTVIDATVNPPVILRPGYITAEMIEGKCGFTPVYHSEKKDIQQPAKSPGMKYTHYAPNADVHWLNDHNNDHDETLYLTHTHRFSPTGKSRLIFFEGDYSRMARELYDWFRRADFEQMKNVVIEPFAEDVRHPDGLIEALKNRISKAARHD